MCWVLMSDSDQRSLNDVMVATMDRLWKLPAAMVEMTVGTMIVMYQLTVARRIVRQEQKRLTN